VGCNWVHLVLRPLLTYCTSPRWYMMVTVDQLIGGMKFGWGNRSTRRKPAQMQLCPPQKSHMTWLGFKLGPPWWETSD
jgi:hypothetical protein